MTDISVFGDQADALIEWVKKVDPFYADMDDGECDWDFDLVAEFLRDAVDSDTLPAEFRAAAWEALEAEDEWWVRGNEERRAEFMHNPNCRYCGGSGTIHSIDWVPYGNGETRMDTYELCDCYYPNRYDTETARA